MTKEIALQASQLSIGYTEKGRNKTIASGLELTLKPGEFVCLLGPNGAGKSTLIRTLAGMQAPLKGALELDGAAYTTLPPRQRAQRLSVVLTETLSSGMMTAEALVSLGRHPYSGWLGGLNQTDRSKIHNALQTVGAEDLSQRSVQELSDGERQKILIARALAQEAKVMLLDEPTAFLDLPRRVELMALLRNLAHRENIALLLSTHDLELALRFADTLWLLDTEGHLAKGPPEELILNGSFKEAFSSEKLDWDSERGAFRTHPEPCLHVYLEGDGPAATWTTRALERLGFGLTTDLESAAFAIQLEPGKWHVSKGNEQQTFNSISVLIDWIRRENWRKL